MAARTICSSYDGICAALCCSYASFLRFSSSALRRHLLERVRHLSQKQKSPIRLGLEKGAR